MYAVFLALFLLYTLNYRYTIHDVFSCDSGPFPDNCCCEVYCGVICLQFSPGADSNCYSLFEEAMIAREKVKIMMDFLIGIILLWLIWEIHVCFVGERYTGQDNISNTGSIQFPYNEARAELILQNIAQSKVPVIASSTSLNFNNEKTPLLRNPNNLPVIKEDATIVSVENEGRDENGVCPICLDDFVEGNDIAWSKGKCKHIFHLDCLQDWLMQSDECPMCRVNYFQV